MIILVLYGPDSFLYTAVYPLQSFGWCNINSMEKNSTINNLFVQLLGASLSFKLALPV